MLILLFANLALSLIFAGLTLLFRHGIRCAWCRARSFCSWWRWPSP
ncbi:hypothetical protein GCM10027176_46330 [Actinoallomurus bryophytorum]|uniref:Uncharacterized protein n=1 Tax=Actinoallomurus bryophytorum TaxID=1490222 RepID=A0A543CUV3_9ACTN|nr:hypothetical protein FB559_6619 [Actinoallomurus bryophytorum]